jgi:flagellin
MPVVINSNATATASSQNLSRANDALRKSLERLSTGKRINSAADDAGGLSVAYKLNSKMNRTSSIIQNSQNALSYLQMQDSSLASAGKIVDRMGELRTMAQDITKNSGDIENYSKEFVELQGQLNQIAKEKFNGISLFSTGTGAASSTLNYGDGGGTYIDTNGTSRTYDTFSRTLQTHDSGNTTDGSVSLNVINFQFMLSIHSTSTTATGAGAQGFNLGNIGDVNNKTTEFTASGYINDIKQVSVGAFTDVIARIADMRAENGAEQNRVMQRLDLLQSNLTNIEAAHGRIMDADIALESTRFARHNILVQASASMTAQANQLSSVALSLIG